MEDQKLSDKRKAPDKNVSSEDLSDGSLAQTPLKRPRMDLNAEEIENDPFAFPDDMIGIPTKVDDVTDEILFKETTESNSNSQPKTPLVLPEENGTKEETEEVMLVGVGENANGDNDGHFFKEIIERESPVESPPSKIETEDNNNEEEPIDKLSRTTTLGTTGKSNSQPHASSSPIPEDSEMMNPSTEIEIVIKAYDPNKSRFIMDETCIKSDFGRLDAFLKSHNVNMSQTSLTGYMGDISQENSAPSGGGGYRSRNRNRWTSSTLGSTIARESIRTIETISPNESPDDDKRRASRGFNNTEKIRGRRDPKMTSTKLSEYSSGTATSTSGKLERMLVSDGINGDESTTNGTSSDSSDKSKKTSLKESKNKSKVSEVSTPASTKGSKTPAKNKSGRKATPAKSVEEIEDDKETTVKKRGGRTPKTPVSREFAGLSSTTTPTRSSKSVDSSPVRIIAKIEGTMAKPTTKFEAEVNNEPVDIMDLSKSTTLWGSIAPKELVFARWRDKNYYSGVVKTKGLNDTWIIDYDDGMEDVASETHIVPIKILGVGVEGVYTPDLIYKPGNATVLGQKFITDPEVGPTVKYAIQLAGESKPIWCTRRQLSIKEVDARNYRQEYMPTPKLLNAAAVSLENIVSGPRRRATATGNTPQSAAKIVGGAFDVSTIEEKNLELKGTPKSRGGKGKRKLSESSAVSDISKSSAADITAPTTSKTQEVTKSPAKESPKKSKAKEESLVFEGYQFFLTASGGAGDSASTESESPAPVIPYDKDEYRDLIESQGGTVIDFVGKEKGKDKIFLVSDNYARTVKYIYCLAGSIPCVSHKWIAKCLEDRTIVDWKSYELNSGWSLEEKQLIPSHRQKPLKGFKIYITAGSDDLYNYWKPVLTAAQATLLKGKKGKGKAEPAIPGQTQVLVTDATCSPEVLADATGKAIPVVKPEWLVQTIITGKKADFMGDEKYLVEPEEFEGEEEDDEDDGDEEEDEALSLE